MKKVTKFLATIACTLPLTTFLPAPLPITVAHAATTMTKATMYHLTKVTVVNKKTYHAKRALPLYQVDFTADRAAAIVNDRSQKLVPNTTYVAVKSITLTTSQRRAAPLTYLQLQDQRGKAIGWVKATDFSQPAVTKHPATQSGTSPKKRTLTGQPAAPKTSAWLDQMARLFKSLRQDLSL